MTTFRCTRIPSWSGEVSESIERLGNPAIDFTPVPDLNYFDSERSVIDGVYDSELALPDAITSFGPSQLFTACRPRFGGKCSDSADDVPTILLLTNRVDLFRC